MTKDELDRFFEALDTALDEHPYKAIPIDLDGKKQIIVQTTAWHIPADLVELVKAANALERLEAVAASASCKLRPASDGSIDVVWDPN